jgi:hypothetical protein
VQIDYGKVLSPLYGEGPRTQQVLGSWNIQKLPALDLSLIGAMLNQFGLSTSYSDLAFGIGPTSGDQAIYPGTT